MEELELREIVSKNNILENLLSKYRVLDSYIERSLKRVKEKEFYLGQRAIIGAFGWPIHEVDLWQKIHNEYKDALAKHRKG